MDDQFRRRAENLDQLKQILRSVIQSNGSRLSIRSLVKEYKNITGNEIPVSSLGYYSLLELLQDMDDFFGIERTDCHRNESEFIVFCLPDKNTQHLVDLIQNQKQSEDKKKTIFRPNPRSDPFRFKPNTNERPKFVKPFELKVIEEDDNESMNPELNAVPLRLNTRPNKHKSSTKPVCPLPDTRVITNDEKNNISQLLVKQESIDLMNFEFVYKRVFNKQFDYKRFGFSSIDQFMAAIPDVVYLESTKDGFRICSVQAVVEESNQRTDRNKPINDTKQNRKSVSKQMNNTSKSFQIIANKKKEIENIRYLLRSHPKGIKVNEFCDTFYQTYKKPFLSEHFGYASPIEMFSKMRQMFFLKKVEHPMGTHENWLLLESSPQLMAQSSSATTSSVKKRFSAQFKENVVKLMTKINATKQKQLNVEDFSSAYYLLFDERIDPKNYGYNDMKQLVIALSKECNIDVKEKSRNKPFIVFYKKF